MYYSAVGPRSTPHNVLNDMTTFATEVSKIGLILRTGTTIGGDSAFIEGCEFEDQYQMFEPIIVEPHPKDPTNKSQILSMAKTLFGNKKPLSNEHLAYYASAIRVLMGNDLNDKSCLLLCYNKSGSINGYHAADKMSHTTAAIRVAYRLKVPIYNLHNPADYRHALNKAYKASKTQRPQS